MASVTHETGHRICRCVLALASLARSCVAYAALDGRKPGVAGCLLSFCLCPGGRFLTVLLLAYRPDCDRVSVCLALPVRVFDKTLSSPTIRFDVSRATNADYLLAYTWDSFKSVWSPDCMPLMYVIVGGITSSSLRTPWAGWFLGWRMFRSKGIDINRKFFETEYRLTRILSS